MALSDQARAMRDAILGAAEAAFADKGFHAARLRDVAKTVGVTQPLIHHYFGSKDALFEAVVARVVADYDAAQREQWDRDPGDVRFFTEGLAVLFAFLGRHRKVARLMWWARLEGRLPRVPESDAMDAKIRGKFVDAKEAGVLRPDVDIEVALLLIDGVTRGFWDRVDERPALREHSGPLTRGLTEVMLAGLLSEAAMNEARPLLREQDEREQNSREG
ncbi:MAG: TetR family transcriptional regulator [Myxococcota bacterium]